MKENSLFCFFVFLSSVSFTGSAWSVNSLIQKIQSAKYPTHTNTHAHTHKIHTHAHTTTQTEIKQIIKKKTIKKKERAKIRKLNSL